MITDNKVSGFGSRRKFSTTIPQKSVTSVEWCLLGVGLIFPFLLVMDATKDAFPGSITLFPFDCGGNGTNLIAWNVNHALSISIVLPSTESDFPA